MNDDERDSELIRRLERAAPAPAEADDERFWQRFHSELDARLASPPPARRRAWWPLFAFGLCAAAAALLLFFRPARPTTPAIARPQATVPAGELAGAAAASPDSVDSPESEDPCELIGDLDSDELLAVAQHLKTGA